jgi:hypothetical protein
MRMIAALCLISLAACSKSDPVTPAAETARKDGETPPAGRVDGYRLSGPQQRGNLAVYLLHDKAAAADDLGCVSLEEALKSGALKVTEKAEGAEVNELQVENTGDKPVYLQAGDTVKGGQQDRTIAVDFVLPPKSGKKTVDAFCVEPGRWSVRAEANTIVQADRAETLNYGGASFALAKAPTPVATKEQKLAVRLDKSQEKVWAAGAKVNAELKAKVVSPSSGGGVQTLALEEAKNSFVEAVEDPAVAKKVDETVAALAKIIDGQPDAVGAAFCINGKIQNVEVYSAAGLFQKLWPKLLRAAAVEAFANSPTGEAAAPPSESDLRALLGRFEGEKSREEVRPGGPTVRIVDREHEVLFDTEREGKLLHRQVLTK